MRPPAIEKMGFFPTSPPVYQTLATWFQPAETGRLLDNCCGTGEAAAYLAKALNCEAWGVELSPQRAAEAAKVLGRLHNAAWQAVNLTPESITFLFLNPPYHHDRFGEHKRLELEFLKTSTPKLIKGGALVYIVPLPLLKMDEVAAHLAGYYEHFTLRRYPESIFNQVVIMAIKRQKYKVPSADEINAIRAWAESEPPLLEAVQEAVDTLLPAPDKGQGGQAIRFTRLDWEPEEIADATLSKGVHQTKEWLDLINPERAIGQFKQPVMPLKKGHVAMLMASGMMGVIRLTEEDGRPMLVKGRVVKLVEKVAESRAKGGEVTETYRDRFVTTVAVGRQSGIEVIEQVEPLSKFMHTYGDQIGAHILSSYRPVYNFDPTEHEIAVLDGLGRTRRPLPGQARAGLLPTQRHVATALARALKKHGIANAQGEQGVGKTTIGAATLALRDTFPAIVLCPPHLVPKWMRELQEVIPGARVMELKRIGRNADDPGDVNDVRRFLDMCVTGRLGKRPVAVIAHTSAKYGAGWKPAYIERTIRDDDGRPGKALCCPECGKPIEVKVRGGITIVARSEKDLGDKRLFCDGRIPGWQVASDGNGEHDTSGNPVWGEHTCGAPLFTFSEDVRRWAIADYLAKHARGAFKLLITDEVHELKAKASDRGIAFHQMVGAVGSTLTLTGTFFGGPSTSIFWLLHRLSAGVRHDFAFDDEQRWAALYGVLETTRRRRGSEEPDEDGNTGNRRYGNQARERPGVSPTIINRLLETTVFLSLKDLGLALPPFTEEVVQFAMTKEQDEQYHAMAAALRSLAIRDRRLLSTWLQWALSRPNSCFRDEQVKFVDHSLDDDDSEEARLLRTKVLLDLPAVTGDEPLPKEEWLADFCRTERRQGRKVLIYVRQTGTRDIQDRVLKVLQSGGIRALILGGQVEPRKREAWINHRAHGVDALIANPELVKTGLDLVMFTSVVFFELQYSLYTLAQAVRRVWRLGQTKPVKAVYTIYSGTMEATALALMGQKLKAAQLVYGDEVGGAIVPEDEGDSLMKLAREALNAAELPDLQALFADQSAVSSSPLGNMILPSAPLPVPVPEKVVVTWADWVQQNKALITAPSARKKKVNSDQVALF